MRPQEKIQRAWMLRELREVKRAPSWLSDELIRVGLDVDLRQVAISKQMAERLKRAVGFCSLCRSTTLLGCDWCWCGQQAKLAELSQIAILRTAQERNIIPRWLPDVALSRMYSVRRTTISRLQWDGQLCPNCGHPHAARCLACFLREK